MYTAYKKNIPVSTMLIKSLYFTQSQIHHFSGFLFAKYTTYTKMYLHVHSEIVISEVCTLTNYSQNHSYNLKLINTFTSCEQ